MTAPTEELLFRGYALPRLHAAGRGRLVGTVAAVLATAAAFGAAHLFLPPVGGTGVLFARLLVLTGVGVVLDLIYLRTRRLGPLIVGHALVDGLLIGGFALTAAT